MGSHAGLPLTCCSHAMSCVHVGDGVQGAERSFELSVVGTKMPGELVRRFPHLYGCTLLSVPQEVQEQVGGGRELGETVIKMLPVCGHLHVQNSAEHVFVSVVLVADCLALRCWYACSCQSSYVVSCW